MTDAIFYIMDNINDYCAVANVMGRYGIGGRSLIRIIRMNWRMTVMSMLACSRGSMHYNDISKSSGLNPRTLSLVLKDLTESRLVSRKIERGPGVRVNYSLTDAGRTLIVSRCPFLEIAAGERISVRGRRVHNR